MRGLNLHRDERSDEVLVSQCRKGDQQAFHVLYDRYSGHVASIVFRILGEDDSVDDLVQETFVEAFLHIDSVRDPARIRGWLATVAVRKTKRSLAARYRKALLTNVLHSNAKVERALDEGTRDLAEALYEALDRLSPGLRIPWTLHRIEGHPLSVVAEECEMSLATVKRRINKADKRLKKVLGNA